VGLPVELKKQFVNRRIPPLPLPRLSKQENNQQIGLVGPSSVDYNYSVDALLGPIAQQQRSPVSETSFEYYESNNSPSHFTSEINAPAGQYISQPLPTPSPSSASMSGPIYDRPRSAPLNSVRGTMNPMNSLIDSVPSTVTNNNQILLADLYDHQSDCLIQNFNHCNPMTYSNITRTDTNFGNCVNLQPPCNLEMDILPQPIPLRYNLNSQQVFNTQCTINYDPRMQNSFVGELGIPHARCTCGASQQRFAQTYQVPLRPQSQPAYPTETSSMQQATQFIPANHDPQRESKTRNLEFESRFIEQQNCNTPQTPPRNSFQYHQNSI
jgi:hypothetical protein